jgi:hypothetical protein
VCISHQLVRDTWSSGHQVINVSVARPCCAYLNADPPSCEVDALCRAPEAATAVLLEGASWDTYRCLRVLQAIGTMARD